jgi:poly(A) polymerase
MFNLKIIQTIKNKIFPFYNNSDLKFVFKKLQEDFPNQSTVAMYVGGCVRKHLSSEKIDDVDIATILTTDQIKVKFKDTKFKVIDSGIKHGTVTLVSEKLKLELTTLRKDIKTDGRHAEIEYTDNWQEDSSRRDFTINAIYLDSNGKIFDPQLGIVDFKKNLVKFIGDPQKRITEDYLRIIRFIRFALEYESEIEKETVEAIKLNLNGIKKISKERIFNELYKILKIKNFLKLNKKESLKKIFLLIFPELKYLERLDKFNTIPDKFFNDKKSLLAILLIDETNNHEYFLHKYNISNELKDNLNFIAKNFINLNKNKKFFQNDLKKNAYYLGKEHLQLLNMLNFLSNQKLNLKYYLDNSNMIKNISLPKFPFNGNFLKNKGIKEGMVIGKTLKILENEWVNCDFKISEQKISKIISDQNN